MYADLDRPPLREAALAAALERSDGLWREIRVVNETSSTNATVAAAARAGEAEGLVVFAESQTAGRGRLGRHWVAPPRAGLTFSVLLRPAPVPPHRWTWLPLLAGVSLARAVTRVGGVEARLKWPNDVLVGQRRRKVAGVLVETDGRAVVVGIGLNVTTRAEELPHDEATSLALEGAEATDRDPLARAILRELAAGYAAWRDANGDPDRGLASSYRALCDTLGSRVQVALPGGEVVEGVASDIDAAGRLVLDTADRERAVAAGDVLHVRPARGAGRPG